jgi:hypothetical protein
VRRKHGGQARKFNKKILKEPEVEARHVEICNEHLSRLTHSERVNETWRALKDTRTLMADVVVKKRTELNVITGLM